MRACDFNGDEVKWTARQNNIDTYRIVTGKYSLDPDRTYVSLCGYQARLDSEVNQLLASGLVKMNQIIGIDNAKAVINHNKSILPNAKWYRGKWHKTFPVVCSLTRSWPGIIYLDTTYYAKSPELLNNFRITANLSIMGTLLIVNACRHARQVNCTAVPASEFSQLLKQEVDETWKYVGSYSYRRTKSRTNMLSAMFYKQK